MSSGTQIELAGAAATANLSDEQILGIDPPTPNGGFGGLGRQDEVNSPVLSSAENSRLPNSGQGSEMDRGQDGRAAAEMTTEMPGWMQAVAGDPARANEAQRFWQEHQALRSETETLRQAAQEVESLRAVAREAQVLRQETETLRANAESLREASQSVERIDAAIFSGDVRAQSEVVAEIARANPAAFRSLFAEAAKVLANMGAGGARQEAGNSWQESGARGQAARGTEAGNANRIGSGTNANAGPTLRENREEWGTRQTSNQANSIVGQPSVNAASPAAGDSRITNHPSHEFGSGESQITPHTNSGQANHDSPLTNHQSPVTSHQSPQFDPAAYASFERTTNDVVARDVRGSIGDTLTRVLPEGVAEGAARRIGEDIFNEVHRALAADRTLSEQVGELLRDRRFGNAEQQRVASLLASRAKQLVPSVARRVIGEWTSSVLGTARTKAARQAAAASRVDIAAAGGSLDSTPLRSRSAGSAREVNYASMSDDEILGM